MNLPDEIKRRQDRLAAMEAAKAKILARATARYQQEKAEYEDKLAKREARGRATGKKAGGKPPAAPNEGPGAIDQVNLTDEDTRIMKVPGGGFARCYNAQAAVATDSMLVVAAGLTQAANDKQQVKPMLEKRKSRLTTVVDG